MPQDVIVLYNYYKTCHYERSCTCNNFFCTEPCLELESLQLIGFGEFSITRLFRLHRIGIPPSFLLHSSQRIILKLI
ncbi:unnamed protein product [Nezara viridula]|uniref:Uncharacterized protein n=1 Tax=Nezara viridula TaxID=85310 RepID=A0A9P0EAR8_NEZVI|nr:unnamed protein product [Nezara viridula]